MKGIYKIKKGLISDKIGDRAKIFDGENSILYTFNETATFIFNEMKKGIPKKDIIDHLQQRYKIAKNIAEKDFANLVADFKAKGIVK